MKKIIALLITLLMCSCCAFISFAGDKIERTVKIDLTNLKIYIISNDANMVDDKILYTIDYYKYFKYFDIRFLEELNNCLKDNNKKVNVLKDEENNIDYNTIDEFADNHINDGIDKKIIEENDCIYKRNSKDYTDIANYIREHIDSDFIVSDYIITEDKSTHLPYGFSKGINVLDIRLNVNGYATKNFGYRIYIMNNIAKFVTFIGNMNKDFDITKLEFPNKNTDEELIDMAVRADNNTYKISRTRIEKYFDMDELKFKCDVEITYIDNNDCYFTTLNISELK